MRLADLGMSGHREPAGRDSGQHSDEEGRDGEPGLFLPRAQHRREGLSRTWTVQL